MAETEFEKVLAGHRQKIQYEHDAGELTLQYLRQADIAKLATAVMNYQKQNPDQFLDTGEYRLLSSSRKNPFVERYLVESGKKANDYASSGDLGHSWQMIYQGQVEPAEVLFEARKIQNKLNANQMTKVEATEALNQLEKRLNTFTQDELWIQAVKSSFTFCGDHADQAQILIQQMKLQIK